MGDRLTGADTLAHVAADALVRMEDDSYSNIKRTYIKTSTDEKKKSTIQSFYRKRSILKKLFRKKKDIFPVLYAMKSVSVH